VTVDKLSRDALRLLYWPDASTRDFSARPSYWRISKSLKVSPKVAKSRMDRMLGGALRRVRVFPDVTLFGLKRTGIVAIFDDQVRKAMEGKSKLLDFVESVHLTRPYLISEGSLDPPDFVGKQSAAMIDVIHPPDDDLETKVELLKSVYGEFTTFETTDYVTSPLDTERLSKAAPLLKELIKSPSVSARVLAKRTDLSERAASRQLEELAKAQAFQYEPIFDARRLESLIFHVGIPRDGRDRGSLVNRFKEEFPDYWLGVSKAVELIGIVCTAEDLGEVDSLIERLKSVDDFKGSVVAIGLNTIDNQPNLEFLQ
jgi:DNA-binding Lrp family transcriptional regulator